MEVSFEGQSGIVHFKPLVGDRLPVKMEVINFHVYHLFLSYSYIGR